MNETLEHHAAINRAVFSNQINHAAIVGFHGPNAWLDNFWSATLAWDGLHYPTSEHLFAAAKAVDPAERETIRLSRDPGSAKYLGRCCELRPDWEEVKVTVMAAAVRAKFTQHSGLAARLLFTGDRHLEEANGHGDRIWGTVGGVGENRLGRILMQIRTELAAGSRSRRRHDLPPEAICALCGCTDSRACEPGCGWTWVDRERNSGACDACQPLFYEPG